MRLFSSLSQRVGRWRVGQQLYSAFLVILALTATVGGLALYSLEQAHNQADELAGKWLQGVGQLATARAAVLESRDYEVKHSRAEDLSYHAEYADKLAQSVKTASAAMSAYQALVTAEPEHKLLATFSKSWTAYQQAQQRVMGLARDKKRQDAIDISEGLASAAVDETLGALEALSNYNFTGSSAAATDAGAVYVKARNMMLLLLAATLLLGLGLAHLITRQLLQQLGGEPHAAAAIAQAAAEGHLTTQIQLRAGDSASLMAQLKRMQDGLATVVGQVRSNAEGVAVASAQIAQGNQDLSQRTEQQASVLEETAASMEELGSTVRQNADNARQANQLAMGASTVAVKGGDVIGEVVETMKGINDSSKKIADIIGVIDGIAFQTNILALNAAVEAARAGEQGRGFAVVASEVRSLAQRSAEAAKEIKGLISTSVERVERGTSLVDRAGVTMNEIVTAIRRVTDIMGEISTASVEQSAGVAQVGEAVTQMDQATQQNAALVEQSAAAAESLKQQAQQLVQTVAVFKLAGGASTVAPHRSPMAVKPPVHPAPAATERRGPDRARNVVRPAFKPAASMSTPMAAPKTVSPAITPAKTGTDDWESF